jgi:glycosyltransferase involved in cell wall biosynthesis
MRLGIDASNIRDGGGVTHLVELLRAANPLAYGFSKVIVWSGRATLSKIEDRSWLVKSHQPLLDRRLLYRAFWQRFTLSPLARTAGCDVLFVPGGTYAGDFHPSVTMSRNMLPFEWREFRRYGWSVATLRYILLRWSQSWAFRRADGLIFLTQYAQERVMRVIKHTSANLVVIPHGVDERFFTPPRGTESVQYSNESPFRLLYVSIINHYKHQWHLAEAVSRLRHEGLPVALDLVGPAYPPALKRLRIVLERLDPAGTFIRYLGPVPHNDLPARYREADACVFASSCENMPNILMEGMASGLPTACSNRGPMPEVLGDAGVFFDPESPDSIADAVRMLFSSPPLRARLAKASFERAQEFSWQRCAHETFSFLASVTSGGTKL